MGNVKKSLSVDNEVVYSWWHGESMYMVVIDEDGDLMFSHAHQEGINNWNQLFDKEILNTESELSVSDDDSKHSDLHGVRECNANDKTDNSNSSSVDGTLEKITDSESFKCYWYNDYSCGEQCDYCKSEQARKTKES